MRFALTAGEKMPVRFAVGLILALVLSGCATPYQREGGYWGNGFREARVDATHFRVAFQATGSTEHWRIVAYFMHRCAELTQELGYDYFVIVDPKNASSQPTDTSAATDGLVSSGRIQLLLLPNLPGMVLGEISLEKSLPPSDPYAFDARALQRALEQFIK